MFKLTKRGKFTVLHAFRNDGSEGMGPNGGLAMDLAGNLYGTTVSGPSGNLGGTVFELSRSRKIKILFNFSAGTDGFTPQASVIRDSSGNLYGTAESGGGFFGVGTVFKLTP